MPKHDDRDMMRPFKPELQGKAGHVCNAKVAAARSHLQVYPAELVWFGPTWVVDYWDVLEDLLEAAALSAGEREVLCLWLGLGRAGGILGRRGMSGLTLEEVASATSVNALTGCAAGPPAKGLSLGLAPSSG